ncbi:ATP-binding protein [Marinobacteraceae bacterium S3BR75-40.1]
MQREYKRLSRRTRLLLNQAEGWTVDFKRDLNGVKHKTLIAFANSPTGGAILVGVEEVTVEGVQRGRVVGCDVSDHARLQIQNKALSCTPPINIQIITENLANRPILRVEVPSGPNKPYCSQSGEYAIRSDGRNRALQPEELLQMFMEQEAEQFVARFRHAVGKLETQVETMDTELRSGVDRMLEDITRLDRDTGFILNELYGRSRDLRAESEAHRDSGGQVERRLRVIKQSLDYKYKDMTRRINENSLRIQALLDHFQIEDPLRQRAYKQITEMARMIRDRDNADLMDDFRDMAIHIYPEIDAETLSRWISDVPSEAGDEEE